MGRSKDRLPVLELGFRPFYLLAALFSALMVPAWVGQWIGWLPGRMVAGPAWHGHEMIFGFGGAVMAGFLLTAVRNWTGQTTARGTALALLVLLWLTGRVLVISGPHPAAAMVDLVFLPLLAICLALPILRTGNRRNLKIIAIVLALASANGWFQAAEAGWLPPVHASAAIGLSLDLVLVLITVMAGRVIPAFTANAVPAARPRRSASIEIAAVGATLALPLLRVAGLHVSIPAAVWMGVLGVGLIGHCLRWWLWQPWRTRSNPLLAMLPVAYLWVPVCLASRLWAHAAGTASAPADHALAVGAMGGLMMAMMMRSALGHTGRPLVAGATEIWAFWLIQVSALLRFLAAGLDRGYPALLAASGIAWTASMLVFLGAYLPILLRPRVDGKPG